MHADKYWQEAVESLVYPPDETGCHYDEYEDLLQSGILGFCGCGCPSDNLVYVAKIMAHIDGLHKDVGFSFGKHTEGKTITYDEWKDRGNEIGSDESLYFMYYFLDTKEFTEHGGSVPGWLTDDGREFMEDVIELYNLTGNYTNWECKE
jgi:hypothetical protein